MCATLAPVCHAQGSGPLSMLGKKAIHTTKKTTPAQDPPPPTPPTTATSPTATPPEVPRPLLTPPPHHPLPPPKILARKILPAHPRILQVRAPPRKRPAPI